MEEEYRGYNRKKNTGKIKFWSGTGNMFTEQQIRAVSLVLSCLFLISK
jgi:hypothetical protein